MSWHLCCRLLFLLLALNCFPSPSAAAQASNVTVEVTGVGPTYDEAKIDAVKNALQYAFKQLVIVDRIISGNDVLRDRVLSTSNGYVERYREKNSKRTDLGYSVEAEITVSATRIENFLGVVTGGGGRISGPLIDQEVQRRIAQDRVMDVQSQARGEIFDRMFENYPMGAVELKLQKVSISPRDPNILVLELEQSYKPRFVQTMEETLRALSIHECEINYPRVGGFFSLTSKYYLCPYADKEASSARIRPHLPSSSSSKSVFGNVCIGYDQKNKAKCFLLDNGKYLKSRAVNNARFQIVGQFIDSNGQNALVHDRCISIGGRGHISFKESLGVYLDPRQATTLRVMGHSVNLWKGFHLSTGRLAFQVEIDAAAVNLQRASHFIAVAGMMTRDGQFVGLTSPPNQSKDPCDLVDDAVRQHTLSTSAHQ